MGLRVEIAPIGHYEAGDLLDTIFSVPSLSGLQEFEGGWVLCNGYTLPAGAKYDALRAACGTSHGAYGTLPTLIDGVIAAGRGASAPPTGWADYRNLGTTDGAVAVTLGISNITSHQHYYYDDNMGVWNASHSYCGTTAEHAGGPNPVTASDYRGDSASHNNMPPYLVVEGTLAKL